MFLGLSSSAGRLLSGVLCDRAWCKPLILTSIVVSSASLPALMMASVSSYSLYLTLSCLFGLLTGSLSPGRFGFLFFSTFFCFIRLVDSSHLSTAGQHPGRVSAALSIWSDDSSAGSVSSAGSTPGWSSGGLETQSFILTPPHCSTPPHVSSSIYTGAPRLC